MTAPDVAQGLSPERALQIARARFPNLCRGGILPKRTIGMPVNLCDVADALAFLSQCRKTEMPCVHSFDLRRAADVSLGAVIVAATALGFATHSWFGVTSFSPHAMIAINADDVAHVAKIGLTI